MKGVVALLCLAAAPLLAQQKAVEGNPKSAVRVIIYEDLQCLDCADFRTMLDTKLLPKYGSTVAFEHRDFPLAKHSWSRRAAAVARYFDTVSPAIGIEFRQTTLAHIDQITPANFNDHVTAFTHQHHADPFAAIAAATDAKFAALVEADFQEGVARGVSKTPTIFVNGEPFVETFAFEAVATSLDKALHP